MSEGVHHEGGHHGGVHLPHGKFPVWGWYLIGGLIVYLLIKKNSSVASMVVPGGGGSQALRSDVNPRQAQADALQLDQLQKQGAFRDAVNALELSVRTAQARVVTDYGQFYDDLAKGNPRSKGFKCPQGKARINPENGRVECMNTNQSHGFIGDVVLPPVYNFIQKAEEFYLNKLLPTPGSGGGGKVGTPPINPYPQPHASGGGGYAPSQAGGVSIANYTGGSQVTPASVLWGD